MTENKDDGINLLKSVVQVFDYDNYQFSSKETSEFLVEIKAKLVADSSKPFERPESFGQDYATARVSGRASDIALKFFEDIGNEFNCDWSTNFD